LGLGILMKRREMDSIKSNSPSYFRQSSRRGQTLVEFAIILPLLLLIIFGVIDLGRAFYTSVVLSNMARSGARFAALNYSNTSITDLRSKIREEALAEGTSTGINKNLIKIHLIKEPISGALPDPPVNDLPEQGEPFTVNVEYQFSLVLKFLWSDSITLSQANTMYIP
jgi:hypothetical protein